MGRNLWACGCYFSWIVWAPAAVVCEDHKVLVL